MIRSGLEAGVLRQSQSIMLKSSPVALDLPPGRPSFITRVWLGVIRPPTLDHQGLEFSGFAQGDGLVTSPDFVSMIDTLFPIAPCGRSSLSYLRQASNFSTAFARVRNQCVFKHSERKRPLKVMRDQMPRRKMNALSVGLPRREKSRVTPRW